MIITNSTVWISKSDVTTDTKMLTLDRILSTDLLIRSDDGTTYPLYEEVIDDKGDTHYGIPIGYTYFIDLSEFYSSGYEDRRTNVIPPIDISTINELYISRRLPGVVLREDQVDAIKQALSNKSGMLQMSTGSGKTLTIVGFMAVLIDSLGYTPPTIILAPTNKIVDQIIEEFHKVGMDDVDHYSSERSVEGIRVTHPASLNNDLDSDPDHISNLQVLISDEGHHMVAETWKRLISSAPNLEVKLAFSASMIDPMTLSTSIFGTLPRDLSLYTHDELVLIGIFGKLLVNYKTNYYISRGVLATPLAFRLFNPADEKYNQGTNSLRNWRLIRSNVIESDRRYSSAVDALIVLADSGRRSLLFCNTKKQGYHILELLQERGYSESSVIMMGGGSSWILQDNEWVRLSDDMPDSQSQIIIGTSVMYEGVDLPQLDAVVLFDIGKHSRVVIQTIGRVLRRTKNGKYAYIIDFTDHKNKTLRNHTERRRDLMTRVIGVHSSNYYDGVTPSDLSLFLSTHDNIE